MDFGEKLKLLAKEGGDLFLILGVTSMVLLMVIPIPPVLMDVLLVFSIALSIFILLISFYSEKTLDFSVFPIVLLFSTLFRLTLNIATTRNILTHGASGDDAAGLIIQAFGQFVAGGSYVVGFIIFIILVVINFVVITKGAGRVAEVAARFTLDSMPGKQLAIDADLNAGMINEKEARQRREHLEQEADFYGAMDGASKFVRGDAIAGIIITIVNIIGGFIIGIVQEGLSLEEALKVYTILTIGDGLVCQIPALIISVAAGVIVTKASREKKISEEIQMQTLRRWKPMMLGCLILSLMALMPGMPTIPFGFMAIIMGVGAYYIRKRIEQEKNEVEEKELKQKKDTSVTEQPEGIPPLDVLELEVGYDLIPLVDQRSGGEFPSRIVGIRRQFANEMGVMLPPVHIRDNLKLKPNEYRIFLKGAIVGKGELMPHHSLALDPGTTTRRIEGLPTKDPTFGLDALWVADEIKENAVVAGYTVVDLPSVMATHLIEIVRNNLSHIFGTQDLSNIVEEIKKHNQRLINDLIPELIPLSSVLKVTQNLLRERVSIRDMVTILETLSEHAQYTKDYEQLTEACRVALGRAISQQHIAMDQQLYVITLDRRIEDAIVRSVSQTHSGSQLGLDPELAKNIVEQIGYETKKHITHNQPPVVLTSQQVRPHLFRLIERFIPNLAVLAHSEVAGHVSVRPVGMVGEAA